MFSTKDKPVYVPSRQYLVYRENLKPLSVPMGFQMEEGTTEITALDDFIEYRKSLKLYYKLKNAGLNTKTMQTYEISDYVGTKSLGNIKRLEKFIEVFPEVKDTVLYFYGGNATQKTTVASWIGKKLLENQHSVKFILMNTLLTKLTAFTDDEIKQANIDDYKSCDWLIIDEAFDKEKTTIYKSGYQIPFLDSFLRERLSSGKGILFVSNIPYTQIEEQGFSHSLMSLIERNVLAMDSFFEWKDNAFETLHGFDARRGLF